MALNFSVQVRFIALAGTVTVAVTAAVPLRVTDEGLSLQMAPVGPPEQPIFTVPVNPSSDVSVMVYFTECPGKTL